MASKAASVAASLAEAGHLSKTSNNSKINSSLLVLAATAVILSWERLLSGGWGARRRVALRSAARAVVGDAGNVVKA